MTPHLLALSVGPVQEFIKAARRTRDLWFGSHLLSEISKAAAKAVQTHDGKLIFPAPSSDADLNFNSPLSVANVIVAELIDSDPVAVAGAAKEAAKACWQSFAEYVFNENKTVIRQEIWREQVDDVLEFYAAWHPYTPQNYHSDRAGLMRLLDARKRCRDFQPARGRAGIPKSSLDGLRESVLLGPQADRPKGSRRRLRLADGEQLDVVGMVKRTWESSEGIQRYPSVARVAADPWLRRISAESSSRLYQLIQVCRTLGRGIIHELDTSADGHPHYSAFPFEGTAVFRSRYPDFSRENEIELSDLDPLSQPLGELTREFGDPSPYLAVLVADGDRMGKALSRLESADDHREFSAALASFAAKARNIVNEQHNGVLVYSGGDDVLAFVPVNRSVQCARALHDGFSDVLKNWTKKTDTELTLSVGIAIAHFMEPLEDLRAYGRDAEQHAKLPRPNDGQQDERNSLAIHLRKRGGGPLAIRDNWSTDLDRRLIELAKMITDRAISGRVAYDMHKIAAVYHPWPEATVKEAIQRDTLSVMQGKQPRGASRMDDIKDLIQTRVLDDGSLRRLANEILIAKALAGEELKP